MQNQPETPARTAPRNPVAGVPLEFIESQMRDLNGGELRVYLYLCAAMTKLDPGPNAHAKAQLDISEIARDTGLTREWANKSIRGLVSKKLIVSSGRNGPGPSWYRLTSRRPSGSEPARYAPVIQDEIANESPSSSTAEPVSRVESENDQVRRPKESHRRQETEKSKVRTVGELLAIPSVSAREALRDYLASVAPRTPAEKLSVNRGYTRVGATSSCGSVFGS